MKFLRLFFDTWMRFAFVLGNIMSAVILTLFYFTVFAPFAILFSLLGQNPFGTAREKSNWIVRGNNPASLDDFKNEF